MEELKQRFSEDDVKALKEILDLISESNSMLTSTAFVQGLGWELGHGGNFFMGRGFKELFLREPCGYRIW